MKHNDFSVYRDVSVLYCAKAQHFDGKRVRRGFAVFCGDVPQGRLNDITNQWEPCVNLRGRAYGARKRKMYRAKTKFG